MDTAERTAVEPPSGSNTYDGFISYSHAADDLLAPRLQAGLQRFAKPWWKRRAVRIFRDESSLAANPHLWSSITEALDDSSWFVLLLSEDAASSEWVGKEIEHWTSNKPSDRILPVVTDGTFGWENGDVTGTSVPPALHGVFTEEPRWVDLRFARDDEQLDLQNPDFSAAVADIAATIRGVPKDELASEEVKQHRRTVRTAWAAGITVTVLAIAAIVAGVFAIGQRNDARDSQALAETEATRANQEADRANTLAGQEAAARAEADLNAEEATRSAQLAVARELAASAVNVLDSDPELSILLTLEAIAATPAGQDQPVEVINALWEAASSHRLIGEVAHGYGGPTNIDLSTDGAFLAVASADGASVRLYETSTLTMLWEYTEATSDSLNRPEFSPDGSLLAVPAVDSESVFTSYVRGEPDDLPNRVLILDASTGAPAQTLEFADCLTADSPTWSPDGSRLTVGTGPPGCPRPEAQGGAWVEVFDTESWDSVKVLPIESIRGDAVPHFDDQGRLYVFGSGHKPLIYSAADYELVSELDVRVLVGSLGAVSPDGSLIAVDNPRGTGGAALDLFDTQSGERSDRIAQLLALPHPPKGLAFSPDGRYLVAATEGSFAIVWDVSAGVELVRVPGGPSNNAAIDSSRDLLYTGHPDGTVRVWHLGPSSVGRSVVGDLGDAPFINSNSFRIGPDLGAALAVDRRAFRAYMQLFELSTGEFVGERIEVAGGDPIVALEGGEFVYSPPESGETTTDLWIKYDPDTATAEPFAGCPFLPPTDACSESGEVLDYFPLVRSIDGSEVAAIDGEGQWALLDQTTGAVIGREEHPRGDEFVLAFGDDWYLLDAGEVTTVVDRQSGEELWTGDVFARRTEPAPSATRIALTDSAETLVILDIGTWEAQWLELGFGRIRALSFGPDERLFAVGDAETLHIVDLEQGIILQTVPIPGVSDVHWFDEEHVLIGTSDGVWATLSLDVDDLVTSATDSLFRTFSGQECFTYRIDPCPTLEEIRAR